MEKTHCNVCDAVVHKHIKLEIKTGVENYNHDEDYAWYTKHDSYENYNQERKESAIAVTDMILDLCYVCVEKHLSFFVTVKKENL